MTAKPETKLNFSIPTVKEPPIGEDLIALALQIEKEALFGQYPQAEAFSSSLVTRDRIIGLPSLEDVYKKEEVERGVDQNTLYQLLRQAGAPHAVSRDFWSMITEEKPRYLNPSFPSPTFFVNESDFAIFYDPNPRSRRGTLLDVAYHLTCMDLEVLAFAQDRKPLDVNTWFDFFATHLDLDVLEKVRQKYEYCIDEDKLRQAEDRFQEVLMSDVKFIPAGLMVFSVRSDQSENTADFSIGTQPHFDAIYYLTDPVMDRVYKRLQNLFFAPRDLARTMSRKVKEGIMRSKELFKRLELTPQESLDYFLSGTTPDLFYSKLIAPKLKNGGINPYPYGEIPISGQEALERYFNRVFNIRTS